MTKTKSIFKKDFWPLLSQTADGRKKTTFNFEKEKMRIKNSHSEKTQPPLTAKKSRRDNDYFEKKDTTKNNR